MSVADLPMPAYWGFFAGQDYETRQRYLSWARKAQDKGLRREYVRNARFWHKQMLKCMKQARQS